MAVRQFDGVDDDIRHTVGSVLADMEYGTVALLFKPQPPLGDWHAPLTIAYDDRSTSGNFYIYEDGNSAYLGIWSERAGDGDEIQLGPFNRWYLVVVYKEPTVGPAHISFYDYVTEQWSHDDTKNFWEWWAVGPGGIIQRSDTDADDDGHFRGLLAVQAMWVNRDAFGSNEDVEAAGLEESLQAWFDAEPDALWAFNQGSAADPVNDLVGDAHQITRVGTVVVTGDDPPGFDWGDEEEVPELTATLAVELNLAGDAATPPATIPEVSAALDVAVDLTGVAEAPVATIPEVSAALDVAVDLAGVAEAPAATVPEVTSSLAIGVDLAGAAETPPAEVSELTASLNLTVDLAGVAEAPSAEVPELTASLNLAVDLAGDVAAPPATVPEITSSLAIGVDLAGAAETPPDIPELEASLRIDLALDGELDVPPATVPELAGALAVEVAASGVLAPPTVEVPELAATLNMAVDLAGAVESPAATVSEVTSELAVAVTMTGVATDPVGRRYRELSLAASERTATVAAPSREVKVE